ncbi:uncharacterized protein [Palaemon carinicauda]|uniref:uncharacterized protein n=1 Tax=Palaemon carinicauda TaxID=392227 RepID=UPI0035B5B172
MVITITHSLKKNGSLRQCGDYRCLNTQTEPDHYPLPKIADMTSYLYKAKLFSTLDLLWGYYPVLMKPEDIPKTAITNCFETPPISEKIAAVQNFLTLSTVKALQEFLHMINYFNHFLPAITATLDHLYSSLQGKLKDLKLCPLQQADFCNVKNALSITAALTFVVPHAPLLLSTNVSDVGIGAVQYSSRWSTIHPTHWPSVGNCPSQNLATLHSTANCCRCTWLSITFAISWKVHPSFAQTPCLWCMPSLDSPTPGPPINANISLLVAKFNCTLQHIPEKIKPFADALSRNTLSTIYLGLDYNALVGGQQKDTECKVCRTSRSSIHWEDIPPSDSDSTLLCDVNTSRPKSWIAALMH